MSVRVDPAKIKIAQPMLSTESTAGSAASDNGDAIGGPDSIRQTRRRTSRQATDRPESIGVSPATSRRARGKTKSTVSALAPEQEATRVTESITPTPPTDWVIFTIRQLGRTLDDIERMRIMNNNRIGAGQRAGGDLPWMALIGSQLDTLEHSVELELKRAWRKHPLAAWAKQIPGAGELLMARLIAEIDGDRLDKQTGEIRPGPLHAENPGKLLAYCGHGDPARAGKIPKGATQEELFKRGSPAAKKATWKLAYQFMRTVGSEPTTRTTEPMSAASASEESDAAIVVTKSMESAPRLESAATNRETEPRPRSEPTNERAKPTLLSSAPETDAARVVAKSNEPSPRLESAATNHESESTERSSRRSPRSPYRDIYDARKEQTEGKLHDKPCVRCGPARKPALEGSPWSDAHRHADALRIVGKRFLIDLWVAARQTTRDTQSLSVGGES